MPRRLAALLAVTLTLLPLTLTACTDDPAPAPELPDALARDMRAPIADLYIQDAAPDLDPDLAPEPDLALDAGCRPAPERCDGLDDDCDGRVDEDPTGQGDACALDQPGVCALGARACDAGEWRCDPRFTPTPETCDEADNDCDGTVDEQIAGEACDTGTPGICATGARRCLEGQLRCVAAFAPGTQRCTGRDEDCDGAIDEDDGEGNPCVGCVDDLPDVDTAPQCAGGDLHAALGACTDGAELHILSHYEPAAARTPVRITRAGVPLVLALSSYEPTTWALELDDRVQLTGVILNGYNQSQVEGLPDGVPLIDRTRPGNYLTACGYAWPADDGGCDTPALVRGAEAQSGRPLTSFQGCYTGAAYTLATRPR
ncbi:MAG: hypothetical protein H6701_11730 [Myxococcales bacterium]|nr:hypothetical protein [Myxococcales bacterium]